MPTNSRFPCFSVSISALRSWSPASLKPRARRSPSLCFLGPSRSPRRSSSLAGTSENALWLSGEQGRSLFGRPKTLGAEIGKGENNVHDEPVDPNRLHRTGRRSSLHAKRNSCNDAVGRYQGILEERGRRLAEPFGMAPSCPYVELTRFSSRLFLLKPVAGG